MLIDTHCHLNFNAFKDDSMEIARQSLEKKVWVINVGSQATTSRRAAEMAEQFSEGIYAAVGLHPCHLYEMEVVDGGETFQTRAEKFDANLYREMAKSPRVVAIGETGIDYHYAPTHMDEDEMRIGQERVFLAQLDLADELNKPVIVHTRETYAEIHQILKSYIDEGRLKRRGVIHCFLGNYDQAKDFLEHGFLISFTGVITFKPKKSQLLQHSDLMEVVKNAPLDRIMIETDAPYLAPDPYRGKRNLPWYVEEVAKKIAEIKNISFEQVAEQTTKNAKEFFQI